MGRMIMTSPVATRLCRGIHGTSRNLLIVLASCSLMIFGLFSVHSGKAFGADNGATKATKTFNGTVTNQTFGATAPLSLEAVEGVQLAGRRSVVTGTLVISSGTPISSETSAFTGLLDDNTVTFTIPNWQNTTDCLAGGCTAVYVGVVGAKESITGYYSYYNTNAGPNGVQSGIWSVAQS